MSATDLISRYAKLEGVNLSDDAFADFVPSNYDWNDWRCHIVGPVMYAWRELSDESRAVAYIQALSVTAYRLGKNLDESETK